jgi:CDP-diacylglycerol--serine O-phosphatidyltransferase
MKNLFKRRYFSLYRIVPSLITLSGMAIGLLALRFAFQEEFQYSFLCIVIAALCDALDGRMARLLNASSKFGAELDSLSDLTVFGIVPAIILYQWQLHALLTYEMGNLGWAIVTIYALACAIRLARFNVTADQEDHLYGNHFFQGVPAPAAALTASFPMIITFWLPDFNHVIFTAIWLLAVALLMVSWLPTFSFKKIQLKRRFVPLILLASMVVIVGILARPWLAVSVIIILYVASFPFAYITFRRNLHKQKI